MISGLSEAGYAIRFFPDFCLCFLTSFMYDYIYFTIELIILLEINQFFLYLHSLAMEPVNCKGVSTPFVMINDACEISFIYSIFVFSFISIMLGDFKV